MSEVRANTISNGAGTGPATLTKQWAAKAWHNFNGTGTVAIRDSENVSSLTDRGVGLYTVGFSNAFGSSDYATILTQGSDTAGGDQRTTIHTDLAPTTTAHGVGCVFASVAYVDIARVQGVVHGDLA